MNFELAEEHRMLKELVRKFVDAQLLPLENAVLAREAAAPHRLLGDEEMRTLLRDRTVIVPTHLARSVARFAGTVYTPPHGVRPEQAGSLVRFA